MRVPAAVLACNAALILGKELSDYSYRNKEFSANTYREIAAENPGNFVGCPMSTGLSLSMVHSGAKKNTAEQLAEGLSLPNSNTAIKAMIEAVMPQLKTFPNCYTLKTINRMYVSNEFEINPHFKRTATDLYKSSVESIDFKQKKKAVTTINAWIEEATSKHIKEVVTANDLSNDSKAVLVNSMSFQGTWLNSFDEKLTKKSKFYTDKDKSVQVDMMETTGTYEYHKCKYFKATFLKMPYVGKDLIMMIILPYEKDGLEFVENMMQEALEQDKYDWKNVHVKIPKFQIDTTVKCVPMMEKLEIVDVFKPKADLTGITSSSPFFITDVIEKSSIEVNEKGTFAAAPATAVVPPTSPPNSEEPVEYIVDHPFIFYIESPAGILFIGRYTGK